MTENRSKMLKMAGKQRRNELKVAEWRGGFCKYRWFIRRLK